MTQTIYRWLSLFVLLIFMTVVPANAEEGQIYTVKKGDTLWDLSQRFIDDPYYWPNVWANNPDITNPHLIFPGQKVRILDGRLEIIPAYPEAEQEKAEETSETVAEDAVLEPEEVITIKSTGRGNGFILTTEQPLGILVDSVDNRVLLTEQDLVFVQMKDPASVTVGDTYSLFSRGDTIKHPVTDKVIGTMMNNLGFLQVTEIKGETVIAKINGALREITRGAELFEYTPDTKEITLQSAATATGGYIIATRDEKLTQGSHDVVFIDRGADDQVASGNLLYISRPRKVSDELLKKAGDLELPDAVLGAAIVIEAKNKTASALIIKSADAMFIGDKITLVNN
ncbi:LysM peptidoglycan-binding domain-containing protein [Malonomonas rubra]|uniref:LysM peptidoglycan-binding domain-containing protein n=1 Tax=Malonomonas rubra TaxID=57040 RepID=UPI0026E9C175|nr:LysM peptidoglycan-binding domain-containing protein [Malonomonas rubra]